MLFHVVSGDERPVDFASRTLNDQEKRIGKIEREAVSIIFSVKHFEMYLFCRHFKLYTDHRPLTQIFKP